MNCMDEIKRELECIDEIEKPMNPFPKVKIMLNEN